MDASAKEYIDLRQQLMEGWWQGFGEQPKINCNGGLEVWEKTVQPFLENTKVAIIERFPKQKFRLFLTAGDGKEKPEIVTV